PPSRSPPTVPAPADAFRPGLPRRRAAELRVNGSRLLTALDGQRDLVSAEVHPDLRVVRVVHLNLDVSARVRSRASEVLDQEHDPPLFAAGVERAEERIGPHLAITRSRARALALLLGSVGKDAAHLPCQL